jgi:formylglycine-generating enzyme required for sulfatase activity
MSIRFPCSRAAAALLTLMLGGCATDASKPAETHAEVDADGDGATPAEGDCDDTNPAATDLRTDADCDGVATADDCDDGDPASTSLGEDNDCDDVPTAEDCDDGDPGRGAVADDSDCDGAVNSADCDDDDAALPAVDDMDCDRVLAADDCDDRNPRLRARTGDSDCDGVLTADDCDDESADVGNAFAGDGCLVRIAASTFDMGCTPGQPACGDHGRPVTPVTLTHDYFLGRTEVTQAQFAALTGYRPSNAWWCGRDCPVETVNWHEAAAFANAASDAAGLRQCYACTGRGSDVRCSVAVEPSACEGFRLPTEAEWEAAARCGEDLPYAGSSTADPVAWTADNSAEPRPVASKAANACGIYDMTGNLWEWTQDWFDSYPGTPVEDPAGPPRGALRVLRGGSFFEDSVDIDVAHRIANVPGVTSYWVGLRLARTAP